MKLEVGKTYRHSMAENTTKFVIEHQWSDHLFEGRALNTSGQPIGNSYMFNATGEALGWRGNRHGASLGWRIVEQSEYEYRLIYEGLVDNKWTRLTATSPRYNYGSSKYLVRERGNHASTRLVDSTELKALQSKAPIR